METTRRRRRYTGHEALLRTIHGSANQDHANQDHANQDHANQDHANQDHANQDH